MDTPLPPHALERSRLIDASYRHFTGHSLLRTMPQDTLDHALALYHAPFVLLSHNTADDPIFCYANLAAQALWEYDWEEFTRLPSRLSAEASVRAERSGLLAQALEGGIIRNYRGVRISRTGKRFELGDTSLWNVTDDAGKRIGQAASFSSWQFL